MIFIYTFIIKYSIFLTYLFSYFYLLLLLISYLFFFNLLSIKFMSELKYLNTHIYEYFIVFTLISFSGLPPFFFFFIKYLLISNIFINNYLIMSIFCLILLFLSWFMYFSSIKYIILMKDDRIFFNYLYFKKYSSFLSIFLFFGFFFLFFGFFFLYDIYLFIIYLFV